MKTIKYFYVFIWAIVLLPLCVGCNDTDDGSYVEPITVYEKIKGDWTITSVKQIDEIAKANSQSPTEMNLTNQVDFSTFTINLNVNDKNQPTSYKVGGTSPQFFPSEGYWELDYPFQNTDGSATSLNLFSDEAKKTKVAQLSITAVPGTTKVLELKFSRKAKGVTFVSYVYQLSPANQ